MEAWIIIDYTEDFVADDGRLTCGERGQAIDSAVAGLIEQAVEQQDFLVFAVDAHEQQDPWHPETNLFPPHNIIGTKGRRLYGQTGETMAELEPEQYYWMDKSRYSAFAGTPLAQKLRERGITSIHLAGVCTDICILHTAVDAYNQGFDMTIHADAVESFDPEGHAWALRHFENTLGAVVEGKKQD
ncbi:cysteine hydrolase family protein [Alkalicoccus chagannorensis]|uniref:cysteine hydrolase family protein n=1 Tax=Alkalicoccus chagannorensis TaxID=427072 RepID=UPI0003F70A7B|nr:isochorismatase family cysteine hydrolase [Alkalicoccus chagannorensis]